MVDGHETKWESDAKVHWGTPLSNGAFVVRGGTMKNADLWYNANTVLKEAKVWGVCVGCADGMTVLQIATAMPYRGTTMRVADLGVLRQNNYEVVPVDDPPHAILLFHDDPPQGEDWAGWDRLRSFFSGPQAIPK